MDNQNNSNQTYGQPQYNQPQYTQPQYAPVQAGNDGGVLVAVIMGIVGCFMIIISTFLPFVTAKAYG